MMQFYAMTWLVCIIASVVFVEVLPVQHKRTRCLSMLLSAGYDHMRPYSVIEYVYCVGLLRSRR